MPTKKTFFIMFIFSISILYTCNSMDEETSYRKRRLPYQEEENRKKRYYDNASTENPAETFYQFGLLDYEQQNFKTAANHFTLASKKGHLKAMLHLALMYNSGLGVDHPDAIKAMKICLLFLERTLDPTEIPILILLKEILFAQETITIETVLGGLTTEEPLPEQFQSFYG
jgi:hypothetical protein